MSRWVVSAYDFGRSDVHDCAFVEAESEAEAAEIGAEALQEVWDMTDGLRDMTIPHVFVGPWPRVAYTIERRFDATVAQWQCCGGPNDDGGHFGGCPDAPADHDAGL